MNFVALYLVVKNTNTGEMLQMKKIESRMSLCEYGDSVIAVTAQTQARIKIFPDLIKGLKFDNVMKIFMWEYASSKVEVCENLFS